MQQPFAIHNMYLGTDLEHLPYDLLARKSLSSASREDGDNFAPFLDMAFKVFVEPNAAVEIPEARHDEQCAIAWLMVVRPDVLKETEKARHPFLRVSGVDVRVKCKHAHCFR